MRLPTCPDEASIELEIALAASTEYAPPDAPHAAAGLKHSGSVETLERACDT